ncbi:histone-like nucleoid-structuring protein Lsr2 [Tessaracoccus caeni]|uniref:histone-like nucleoid-structuring protein Lsr2 n=1 Tax=Tessaracoccus caeni TaxID=3031239 RepID=UPI0023DCDB73|nr:Lsr2 family protein [Tessaracoccus caeni]MDF1487733.1 Lsr2 family protein [Tessaracoccus caeni]
MARKVEVTLVDDIDGTPAERNVTFALEGKTYEIDLSQGNYDKLAEALAPFVEKGRRVTGSRSTARSGSAPRRTPVPAGNAAAIRSWASENGYEVSDRGRIPADVVAAYEAAHNN